MLPPGSTVILYTDGLIERRSQPLDDGMERLRDAVGTHGSGSVSALLEQLIRVVPDAEHGDDICALAARLAP